MKTKTLYILFLFAALTTNAVSVLLYFKYLWLLSLFVYLICILCFYMFCVSFVRIKEILSTVFNTDIINRKEQLNLINNYNKWDLFLLLNVNLVVCLIFCANLPFMAFVLTLSSVLWFMSSWLGKNFEDKFLSRLTENQKAILRFWEKAQKEG